MFMKQEEKFKIWNATNPSVAEVWIYLNRLRGKQPDCKTLLPLIYYKSGQKFVCNSFLPDKKRHLYGIMLKKGCMLSLKAITKRNINAVMAFADKEIAKGLWTAKELAASEARINHWVIKHCSAVFCSMAAYNEDIENLKQQRDAVQQTLEVLRTHGVKIPDINWDCLVWLNEGENYCRSSRKKYDVREYLETKGDILIFQDTEPDLRK